MDSVTELNALALLWPNVAMTEDLSVINLTFSVSERNEQCHDLIFRGTLMHFIISASEVTAK